MRTVARLCQAAVVGMALFWPPLAMAQAGNPDVPAATAETARMGETVAQQRDARPAAAPVGPSTEDAPQLQPVADAAAVKAPPPVTVMLVHGEFVDGSSWRRVIPLLSEAGVRVVAVQLPLNSLWADVAVVQRALALSKGPVVLVGHSWGGVIITEAGVDPKVAALVYVSSVAPDVGQSLIDRVRNGPMSAGLAELRTDPSGFVLLSRDGFVRDFANDMDPQTAALLASTQAPVFRKAFEDKVNNAAWKSLPSWYVLTTADRMLDPGLQQTQADLIKARITRLDAGHASMLSQPQAVADVILDAVKAVQGGISGPHDGPQATLQPVTAPPPAGK